MQRFFLYLTFLACILLADLVIAQPKLYHQYLQDRWSVDNGLIQVVATSIAQDAQGYIWIGSQIGLSRFDGINFEYFTTNNSPLISGFVRKLYTDSQGRLWIGTNRGLQVKVGNEFLTIDSLLNKNNPNNDDLDIQEIVELADHQIIVSTNRGIYRVDLAAKQTVALNSQYQIPANNSAKPSDQATYALMPDHNSFWYGGLNQVIQVNPKGTKIYHLNDGVQTFRVEHLLHYAGTIFAGTTQGLYQLLDGKFSKFSGDSKLANTPIDSMMVDSHANMWVGTNAGMFHLINQQVSEHIDNENSKAFPVITSMFEDREENLWFGSYTDGISRLRRGSTFNFGVESGLSDPLVWSVAKASNNASSSALWIGTNNGLNRFENGQFQTIVSAEQLPHPVIYTMLEDSDQLILGTRAGIAVLKNGIVQIPPLLDPIKHGQTRAIIADGKGGYYFGTSIGLFHQQQDSLVHYAEDEEQHKVAIRYLKKTIDGRLLLGCEDGVYLFENSKIRKVSPQFENKNIDVTFIYEHTDKTLVIGTTSNGLVILANNQWTRLTTEYGAIPSPGGFYIDQDSVGNIWVSSFNALYSFPYANLHPFIRGDSSTLGIHHVLSDTGKIFGTEKSECCNGAGTAKGLMINDEIILPSNGGITRLNTQELSQNNVEPTSVIEKIKYLNQWNDLKYNTDMITLQKLALPSEARDIVIQFTALSLQAPKNIQIKYQLIGYDVNWNILEDVEKRQVAYTNLPTGEYQLLVQSANNFGVWQSEPTSFKFQIAPYFYETWWFYLLEFSAILLVLFSGYKWRVRALKKRTLLLEIEVEKRTQELSVANQKLTNMSYTDPLTGLKNRRYLHEQINKDIAYFNRLISVANNADSTIALMMIDIDHFKLINDNYGHAAGDQIITKLSEILLAQLREDDYIVRWGGEEFLIVSRSVERNKATHIADRLCRSISSANLGRLINSERPVTCSIGFALMPFFTNSDHVDLTWEDVVEIADRALYKVKQNGRNGWATYQAHQQLSSLSLKEADSFETFVESHQLKLTASWLKD